METSNGIPVSTHVIVARPQVSLGAVPTLDDIIVNEDSIEINDPEARNSFFDVDRVYSSGENEGDIYDGSIAPLVEACLKGESVCLIVFGSTKGGRRQLFEGRDGTGGLTRQVTEAILSGLKRKESATAGKGGRGRYSYEVHMSYVEAFDDLIQDLFNAQNSDLVVADDPVDGPYVRGAVSVGPIRNGQSLPDLLASASSLRSDVTLGTGAVEDYASAVMRLEVEQNSPSEQTVLRSTFTIVDLAGAEKLVNDPAKLKATESPTLNKSTIALSAVMKAIKNGDQFPPFSASKLTSLLQEPLGGNCRTLLLCCCYQSETAVSLAALAICSGLQMVHTYPVTNTSLVRGLLRKLRGKMLYYQDRLNEAKSNKYQDESKAKEEEATHSAKIHELEGKLIKDNLEKLRIEEEKKKALEKLAEMKNRLQATMEKYKKAQEDIIVVEEEKLRLSKALLDLQLENNSLKESVDKEKYELSTRVITAETSAVENEVQLQEARKKLAEMQEVVKTQEQDMKDLTTELVTLKTNLVSKTKQLKVEQAKTEELGAEILTLVNKVDTLEGRLAATAESAEATESQDSEEKLRQLEREIEFQSEKARQAIAEAHEARNSKLQLELAFEKAKVEFSSKQLEFERQISELSHALETSQASKGSGSGRGSATAARLQATAAAEKRLREMDVTIKEQNRQIIKARDRLEAQNESYKEALERAGRAERRVQELTSEHAKKLMEYLLKEDEVEARKMAIEEMISTHRWQETELGEQVKSLRARIESATRRNQTLHEQLKEAQMRLVASTSSAEERQQLEKDLAKSEKLLRDEVKEESEGFAEQLKSARAKYDDVMERLARDKEESVARIEEVGQRYHGIEKELQKKEEELKAAREQLSQLLSRVRPRGDGEEGEEKEGEGPVVPASAEAQEKTVQQLETLQTSVMQKLEEIREEQRKLAEAKAATPPPPSTRRDRGPSQASADDSELRKEIDRLKSENAALKGENTKLSETRKSARHAIASARQEYNDEFERAEGARTALLAQIESLQDELAEKTNMIKRMKETSQMDETTLLGQLQQSEERGAELMSRNTVLEAELKNYKEYMKTTIAKYKKEVAKWKKAAGGGKK